MKNLCFWRLLFQKKIADIWNFNWIKYLGKGLSYLKNWDIEVNYCWNYGPSKLLLHFIKYRLDQLNIKHTKTSVNSTIQDFEDYSQKKCLLKVWIFLTHTPQNGDPVKFLRNWTETNHLLVANIFKLHEYQTFDLMKMHNMCIIWFVNNIFSLWRWNKKYFSWFFRAFSCQKSSQTWDCAFHYIGY